MSYIDFVAEQLKIPAVKSEYIKLRPKYKKIRKLLRRKMIAYGI